MPAQPAANAASICAATAARLAVDALAQAVGAQLGEHQRLLAGQVLEPREVAAELRRVLQVDVERDKVDERQPQVLGARVVDVGDERAGVLVAHRVAEPLEEPLDAARPCQRTIGVGISLPTA